MVSVIIPNYNKAQFISQTIISVINQSYENWECIIIDDNSKDNSIEVIEKHIKGDHRFKFYLNKINKGGSYSRNLGLKNSENKYVLFLDSDDVLASNCLENRINFISENENLDFVVFPMGTFYNDIGDSKLIWNNFYGNHINRFLKHDLPWHTMMVLWNRNSLNRINGFDDEYVRLQDVELHTRALLDGFQYEICFNSDIDSYFRIDENRISTSHRVFLEKKIMGVTRYVNDFLKILKIRGVNNIKYLKGPYFIILSEIQHSYNSNKINHSDKKILISILQSNYKESEIFNKYDLLILRFYNLINKSNIKVRGLNNVTKKLLIR
jgi:glycosyltransferase involved in cell wall biosynthesis